ncbi:MAG: flavodoxin family protein [Oscillospiraceae bacterium]|nr:flavodoxin family protein [Oscillospiraceae bacterium]
MKIIIINGSLRKNGATAYILHRIEKTLSEQGAEVVFYNLTEQKIALCKGCCVCYKSGGCVIDDDAERISLELESADGVVLGSSTIASNVSAVMKMFIDRGHFVIEQLLYKKYAVCVTTYENYGGKTALKVLTDLVKLSGAAVCGSISAKIPFNAKCADIPMLNVNADKRAKKLYSSIERKKRYPLQRLFQTIAANVGIKPLIRRKGAAYEAVSRRWKELGVMK